MQILGSIFSPYVIRPVLVGWAKGHDIALAPAPGGLKSPAYLRLHPLGRTPSLIDGDMVLPESAVIAEYLEEVLDGPPLLPGDPKARALVRLVARFTDTLLSPGLTALFRGRTEPDQLAEAMDLSSQGLLAIAHFRRADDRWAAADAFTLADAALMPMLFMYDYFDAALGTGGVTRGQPSVAAYWGRARQSPIGARMSAEMQAGFDRILGAQPA